MDTAMGKFLNFPNLTKLEKDFLKLLELWKFDKDCHEVEIVYSTVMEKFNCSKENVIGIIQSLMTKTYNIESNVGTMHSAIFRSYIDLNNIAWVKILFWAEPYEDIMKILN